MTAYSDLNISDRVLMGPGPSNVHPRVLRAMATPLTGHLDPEFLTIMNETQELLRFLFQTENRLTIPMSGTGSAGMETCFCNLIEPGDPVLVCVNGLFGERMSDVAVRCGAELTRVEVPWGEVIDPEQVRVALEECGAKVVAIVHAETSTGVRQPLPEISRVVHERNALLLVDAVTSLGGCEVEVDAWAIDVCYSGTQKCLSCPPGLAPVTFNDRAMEVIRSRGGKVQSWYLDLTMIEKYWGDERSYHHTAPISMNYALREALRLIYEEGLEKRFARHRLNHEALVAGLEAMGLEMLVKEPYRLPMLNAVRIPSGVEDARVRGKLLQEFGIEMGGGLGELKGTIWRVGLMGYTSTRNNVLLFLSALEAGLRTEGFAVASGVGVSAALDVYSRS